MNNEKIISFKAPREAAIEDMIDVVRSIIERIESGEIEAITYALIRKDGYTTGAFRLPGVHPAQVATAAFGLALDAAKVDTG